MPEQEKPFPVLPIAVAAAAITILAIGMVVGMAAWGMGNHHRGGDAAASPTVIDESQVTVRIADFTYFPSNVSVPVGATVTWRNTDSAPHDATDDSGAWATEILRDDETGAVTFDAPGQYTYHCSIHPRMKGKLTVRAD